MTIVEIALHDVAVDIAFRERAGTVRAQVVGDEELSGDVEDRKHQIVNLDLKRGARRDVGSGAQIDKFY